MEIWTFSSSKYCQEKKKMCTHGFTAQLASYVILHETALQYPLVTHGKRVITGGCEQGRSTIKKWGQYHSLCNGVHAL